MCVVVSPAILLAILGLPSLLGKPLSEPTVVRSIYVAMVLGVLSALAMLGVMLATDNFMFVVHM